MNLAQKNHNPGNLEYRQQREAIGTDGRFAVYLDDPAGWRGLVDQIKLDQKRGKTFSQFLHKYAPKEDKNNTGEYLADVCEGLRASFDDSLSLYSPYAVAAMIAKHEGYFNKE